MTHKNITELFNRFFQGIITAEEKEELATWISQSEEEDLTVMMKQAWEQYEPDETLGAGKSEQMLEAVLLKAKQRDAANSKVINLKYRRWWRLAAAAAIIGITGAGGYILFNNTPGKNVTNIVAEHTNHDIAAPNSVNAVLTLANGQQIVLDSAQNGQLASQGNVNVLKLSNDKLAYNGVSTGNKKVEYNTLTVPRGSRVINLVLADGTSVVLNAASSITYPTAFAGDEREVEISGEAYFEIAKDPTKKFIVSTNGVSTEVLGTHFNINAYNDMGSIDITLLEGRVKVTNDETSATLAPGQQAQLNKKGKIDLNKEVDIDQVMAWKNGLFNFSSQNLESIMLQLSRWYNVDVVYEGKKSEKRFSGIMSRNDSISEVLRIMELAGLKFKIEGKKVTVRQ